MSNVRQDAEPRYQRVRRQLETNIRSGLWAVGEQIPGERELARQSGVSQMTVNRAIQEMVRAGWLVRRVGAGTFVSEASREPFREAQLTLLVVTPFTDHPEDDVYLSRPFGAIQERASAANCPLMVTQADESRFLEVTERHPHAEFVFVAPSEQGYGVLECLHEQHAPFVVLGASWPDAPFACVDSDNAQGARLAVEYLATLGHERILYINGPQNSTNCRDRLRGYRQGIALRERQNDPDLTIQADSVSELSPQAKRQLTRLLLHKAPATAILCGGYLLALAVLRELRSLRLRVPEDVSVIGFDDPSSAAHLTPPLTVVRQPLYELGARAAQRLLPWKPPTGDASGVEYLDVELIVRESCDRPRG